MDWAGEGLIHWHHDRCGKSEEAHSVMKAIRFSIINHPSLNLLIESRRRIAMLVPIPTG